MAYQRLHLATFGNPSSRWDEFAETPDLDFNPARISFGPDGVDGDGMKINHVDRTGGGTAEGARIRASVTGHCDVAPGRIPVMRWAVKFPAGFAFGRPGASAKIGGWMLRRPGSSGVPGGGEDLNFIGYDAVSMRDMFKYASSSSTGVPLNNEGKRIGLMKYAYLPGMAWIEGGDTVRGAYPLLSYVDTGALVGLDTETWYIRTDVFHLAGANQAGWLDMYLEEKGSGLGPRQLKIGDQQWQAEVLDPSGPVEDPGLVPTRQASGRLTGVYFSQSGSWDPGADGTDLWWQQEHFMGGPNADKTAGEWAVDWWEVGQLAAEDDEIPAWGAEPETPVTTNLIGFEGPASSDGNGSGDRLRGNDFRWRIAGALSDDWEIYVPAGAAAATVALGFYDPESGELLGETDEIALSAQAEGGWENLGPILSPFSGSADDVTRVLLHVSAGSGFKYATLAVGSTDPYVESGLLLYDALFSSGRPDPLGDPAATYSNTMLVRSTIVPASGTNEGASAVAIGASIAVATADVSYDAAEAGIPKSLLVKRTRTVQRTEAYIARSDTGAEVEFDTVTSKWKDRS